MANKFHNHPDGDGFRPHTCGRCRQVAELLVRRASPPGRKQLAKSGRLPKAIFASTQ